MRWLRILLLLVSATGLTGCAIVQVSVRNPVVGLEKVAVAPFFNLSSERTVDGRDFAEAYYTELQKVPGFEVVPVGIAERAIRENQLTLDGPEDALRLARILNVDAVVVGAITDYDPYVPRVGLKVSWYSNQEWDFLPTVPLSEQTSNAKRRAFLPESMHLWGKDSRGNCPPGVTARTSQQSATIRGQSPGSASRSQLRQLFDAVPEGNWQSVDRQVAAVEQTRGLFEDDGFLPPRAAVMPASRAPHAAGRPASDRPADSKLQPASQQYVVPNEYVYDVVDGPLFGEPRVVPNSSYAPTATVLEESEFIEFPGREFIVSEPGPVASPVVYMPDTEGNLIPVTFEPQTVVVTQPLPLPLPPSPIVPGSRSGANLHPAASSEASLELDLSSDAPLPLPLDVPEVLQPRKRVTVASQTMESPTDNVPRSAVPTGPSGNSSPISNAVGRMANASPDVPANPPVIERPNTPLAPSMNPAGSVSLGQRAFDPHQPLMSYVRMFDATDANLVARLSDYLELSGETRTGDVSAFMRRTEFFQKFTAHVMISEMLSLHGGESRRRWVMKSRQYR